MRRTAIVAVLGVLLGVFLMPPPAAADWLLSAFVGKLTSVKTQAKDTVPAENFDSSTGFGVNLASAFPSKGNVGFELDWGLYKDALAHSDVFGTAFASKLMAVSTNVFYSPGTPRVRPGTSRRGPPSPIGRTPRNPSSPFPPPGAWVSTSAAACSCSATSTSAGDSTCATTATSATSSI